MSKKKTEAPESTSELQTTPEQTAAPQVPQEQAAVAPTTLDQTAPPATTLPDASKEAEHMDVDALITAGGLPPWKGAALCRNEGWAPGKLVTQKEFDAALNKLEHRPMGG